MGSNHSNETTVRNPGPFVTPASTKTIFLAMAVIGIALFALGLKLNPDRAWSSLVINHFFFFGIAICGLFFAVIQWVVSAMWSAPVRRIMEAFTAYLPFALVSLVVIFFGIHHLYHWSHPEFVKGDLILEGKAGYLNPTFFIIRNLVAFGLWFFFSAKFVGNSLKQDQTKDPRLSEKNKTLGPIFLITFAITFTMASFDILMSLDPHWFSTMFGVYMFAGSFYASLATMSLFTMALKKKHLAGIVNENHMQDLGKFMFAFTIFWAYIGVSQFLLIWYANLPEETGYFLNRSMSGGWMAVSIFLLVGKFLVPFLILMRRMAKRNEKILAFAAIWMLASQWIDIAWVVQPEFFTDGPKFGWIEAGTFVGFLGVFVTLVLRFLGRHNAVAIGDPKLAQSVFGHHQ